MPLPRTLKNMMGYLDGMPYAGDIKTFTQPKITHKMEEYRGGGMLGSAQIDLGLEAMEATITAGGFFMEGLKKMGANTVGQVRFRAACAMQRDDTGMTDAVGIIVQGRIKEFDPGDFTVGELNETSMTIAASYYKVTVNGRDILEVDPVNMVYKVNGKNMLQAQLIAMGISSIL